MPLRSLRLPILAALLGAFGCFTALAATPPPAPPVLVVFETELGPITLAVDVAHAPLTAANFLRYVDGHFYDGGRFTRAVRPDNTTRHDIEIHGIQLFPNPARAKDEFPPIPLERTNLTGLKHYDGTVTMARDGPDTATSALWIAIGDQFSLDYGGQRNPDGQGFATFARVVAGMDVVKKIQSAPTSAQGAYGSETLAPPIKILTARRTKK